MRAENQSAAKSARKYFWNLERRRYVRFPFAWKIKFYNLDDKKTFSFHPGNTRDLSQGGMRITSFQAVKPKDILVVEIDHNLFSIHVNLNSILRVSENKILARVAWRHLNLEKGLFEAGIEFLQAFKASEYEQHILKAKSL